MKSALKKRAAVLGISKHIRFLGTRNDVENILAGSDIAVNTSDSEGFSNSLLEAMRAGIPVIASNVGGNRELLFNEKQGLLFNKGDKFDFVKKIVFLVNNNQLILKYGKSGKKHAKDHFSISKMIDNHIDFYHKLCS
jgi:glycosyltransferase involved in cell wall biosynthesis